MIGGARKLISVMHNSGFHQEVTASDQDACPRQAILTSSIPLQVFKTISWYPSMDSREVEQETIFELFQITQSQGH